jgi:hypothetical protein
MNFTPLTCGIFVAFLIKEELLCRRVRIFAFQLTAHIELLKEDYYV